MQYVQESRFMRRCVAQRVAGHGVNSNIISEEIR